VRIIGGNHFHPNNDGDGDQVYEDGVGMGTLVHPRVTVYLWVLLWQHLYGLHALSAQHNQQHQTTETNTFITSKFYFMFIMQPTSPRVKLDE